MNKSIIFALFFVAGVVGASVQLTQAQMEADTEAVAPDYSIPENVLQEAQTMAAEIERNRDTDKYNELRPSKDPREQTMNALGYTAQALNSATEALGGTPQRRK